MKFNKLLTSFLCFVFLSSVLTPGDTHPIDTARTSRPGAAYKNELLLKAQAAKKLHGPDSPQYAKCLYNLGWMFLTVGDSKEAEKVLRQALAILQKQPPEDVLALDLADLKGLLGKALFAQSKCAEAKTLFLASLEVQQGIEPKRDSVIYSNLEGLTDIYEREGDLAQAEKYCRLLLENTIKRHDHLDIRMHLGTYAKVELAYILCRAGHKGEARKVVDRYFDQLLRLHPDKCIPFFSKMAIVYSDLNDPKRAEDLLRKSLSAQEAGVGGLSPAGDIYLEAAAKLTSLLKEQHRDQDRLQVIEHVLAQRKQTRGHEYLFEIELFRQAAECCINLGRYDQAKKFAANAKNIAEKNHNLTKVSEANHLLDDILKGMPTNRSSRHESR
ncbi:MAG: hypothetical protein C5B53_00080 [Candidatus Melainabacteria bacterium]|nr:MAG: hypothetical protein C5B53_00080 [Candidatus Melainabacteria bacterium]